MLSFLPRKYHRLGSGGFIFLAVEFPLVAGLLAPLETTVGAKLQFVLQMTTGYIF